MVEHNSDGSDSRPHGLLSALKTLAGTLLATAQTRLEILSTEIEEEKIRIGQQLLLVTVVLFCFGLGIVFLAAFLTVLFWESHRLFVLGTLTLLFLGGGTAALLMLRAKAGERSRLFADSLGELAKDRDQLSRP
jgi:uncharacterized membrane protein YqjE